MKEMHERELSYDPHKWLRVKWFGHQVPQSWPFFPKIRKRQQFSEQLFAWKLSIIEVRTVPSDTQKFRWCDCCDLVLFTSRGKLCCWSLITLEKNTLGQIILQLTMTTIWSWISWTQYTCTWNAFQSCTPKKDLVSVLFFWVFIWENLYHYQGSNLCRKKIFRTK